ncbi:hypothetical protein ACFQU7_15620 [Pseudoroseomonas wenyumeiae]
MQTMKLALALGLGLTLAGGAQAQPGSGTAPNTGATQAPAPQPNRPQSDSRVGQSPQPQAANLRDYASLLKEAQQRLETAVERSGNEPAANDQKAVTPAWMDLKSAAQAAYDAVNRAPGHPQRQPLRPGFDADPSEPWRHHPVHAAGQRARSRQAAVGRHAEIHRRGVTPGGGLARLTAGRLSRPPPPARSHARRKASVTPP